MSYCGQAVVQEMSDLAVYSDPGLNEVMAGSDLAFNSAGGCRRRSIGRE